MGGAQWGAVHSSSIVARAKKRNLAPKTRQSWRDGADKSYRVGDVIRALMITKQAELFLAELKVVESELAYRELRFFPMGKLDSLVTDHEHKIIAWQRLCEDPKGIPSKLLSRGMRERERRASTYIPNTSCIPLTFKEEHT